MMKNQYAPHGSHIIGMIGIIINRKTIRESTEDITLTF